MVEAGFQSRFVFISFLLDFPFSKDMSGKILQCNTQVLESAVLKALVVLLKVILLPLQMMAAFLLRCRDNFS